MKRASCLCALVVCFTGASVALAQGRGGMGGMGARPMMPLERPQMPLERPLPPFQPANQPNHMPGWDWWKIYPWSPYNYGRNPYNPIIYPPYYPDYNPYPYGPDYSGY